MGTGVDRTEVDAGPGGKAGELVPIADAVSGDAAVQLGEDGRFRPAANPAGAGEITEPRTRELAEGWARTFARFSRRSLERSHGEATDLERLRACGPACYAATPFEAPPRDHPLAARQLLGSYWLISLCGAAERPQVSIAVSSLATNLDIVDGRIHRREDGGMEFVAIGIPAGWDGPIPDSPERAVSRVAGTLGRRIEVAPSLVAPDPRRGLPQSAAWRLVLESPVRLRARARNVVEERGEVYVARFRSSRLDVGPRPSELGIPSATQPRSFDYVYPTSDSTVARARTAVRAGRPIAFEAADPAEGGR